MTTQEKQIVDLVKVGFFHIDVEGRIWKHKKWTRTRREVDIDPYICTEVKHDGYLQVRAGRTLIALAHRVVWLSLCGDIADGLQINHKNGVRHDNRPYNLEVVTPGQNLRHAYDCLNRSRVSGTSNGRAKLSLEQVADIRERVAQGEKMRAVARAYGISHTNVQGIVKGKLWRDELPEVTKSAV